MVDKKTGIMAAQENPMLSVQYKCPGCGDVYPQKTNSCFCGWSEDAVEFFSGMGRTVPAAVPNIGPDITRVSPVMDALIFLNHLAGLKEFADKIGPDNWFISVKGGYRSDKLTTVSKCPQLQSALLSLAEIYSMLSNSITEG